ncbi:hypothetical protein SLS55_007758 [Diplodia seriata]|uniref:Uncharacterized protein n=1 Tax=Diplodia seriata TaxID=420778 RepID=A0ABR3C8J4_9PEZI
METHFNAYFVHAYSIYACLVVNAYLVNAYRVNTYLVVNAYFVVNVCFIVKFRTIDHYNKLSSGPERACLSERSYRSFRTPVPI